jgi:transcriptional regulator with XRE-family HTH domain
MSKRIRGPQARRRTFMKEWRKHRGMTLETAAPRFGMSDAQLSRIENAKSPYTQDVLELAARVYETDVASILFRDPKSSDALWGAITSVLGKTG